MYENVGLLLTPVNISTRGVTGSAFDGCKLPATKRLIVTDSGYFCAVDVQTKSEVWVYSSPYEEGESIVGVLSDGQTFITASANSMRAIRDIGSTYSIVWEFTNPTQYLQGVGILGPALAAGDKVYYHTIDSNNIVHVICVQNGSLVFDISYPSINNSEISFSFGVFTSDAYYFGRNLIHAVDANGNLLFANKQYRDGTDEYFVKAIGEPTGIFISTYYISGYETYYKLYRLDFSGNKVFSFNPGVPSDAPSIVCFDSKIAVSFRYVDKLYFLDYQGNVLYQHSIGGTPSRLPISGVIDHVYYWYNHYLKAVNINDYGVKLQIQDTYTSSNIAYMIIPWDENIVFLLMDYYDLLIYKHITQTVINIENYGSCYVVSLMPAISVGVKAKCTNALIDAHKDTLVNLT